MVAPVVIGIDPDSKTTAWAAVRGSEVRAVGVFNTKKSSSSMATARLLQPGIEQMMRVWQPDLVVVEGQQFHYGGTARPSDIILLAQIAGAIAGMVLAARPVKVTMPTPSDWKGQTKKHINQARTFAHYGILSAVGAGYSYPTGCKTISRVAGAGALNKSDWKHVGDALGLARFGYARVF